MTTKYAVRGSRQMVILTVIIGFHFGMLVLIASGTRIDACNPAAARRRNHEGRAVARITIDATGKARAWSVAESAGSPILDAALPCVIEPLDFVAGRRDGRAVEAEASG